MSNNSRAMSAIPHQELPILEQLITLRNRLTALKRDGSEFIRPSDVQEIYKGVLKQITKLNSVRDERNGNLDGADSSNSSNQHSNNKINRVHTPASHPDTCQFNPNQSSADGNGNTASSNQDSNPPSSSSSSTNTSQSTSNSNPNPEAEISAALNSTNRVDTTLNDVFALLSLFFLTIGRGKESPATFSQLGCMKQLLDHLAEAGVYTEIDLIPFEKRLKELREIIRKDNENGKSPAQLNKLMMRQLEGCEKTLSSLQGTLSVLSAELVPIHQKLVGIRRQIAMAAAKPKPAKSEIKQLQEELRKIDSKRVDGKFLGPGGSSVPAGQAILVGLLEESFEICHDVVVKNRNDEIPGTLHVIFERLSNIKSQLENLVLTQRWTLRETDLWNYQVSLKEIDRLRVNGKFLDSEGKVPDGQLVLLYLLRRCYGLIYRLVASSEPISEELMPISNKLSTVSKCLREISKFSGPFTMRDLYPYKLALHQIDGMRSKVKTKDKDGKEIEVQKWLGRDGSIPEGQAILKAQYEEVEQTIEEMLNREEEDDEDSDEEDGGGNWNEDESNNSINSVSDDDGDTFSASASAMSEDESHRSGIGSSSLRGSGFSTSGGGQGNIGTGNLSIGDRGAVWNRWRNESSQAGIPPISSSNNGSYPTSPAEISGSNSNSTFQLQQQQSQPPLSTPEKIKPPNLSSNNSFSQTSSSVNPSSSSSQQQQPNFGLEKISNDQVSNQEISTPIAPTNSSGQPHRSSTTSSTSTIQPNPNLRTTVIQSTEIDSNHPSRSDSPTPKPSLPINELSLGTSSLGGSSSNPTAPFGAVEPLSSQLSENLSLNSKNEIEPPVLLNLSAGDLGAAEAASQDGGLSSDSEPRSI